MLVAVSIGDLALDISSIIITFQLVVVDNIDTTTTSYRRNPILDRNMRSAAVRAIPARRRAQLGQKR